MLKNKLVLILPFTFVLSHLHASSPFSFHTDSITCDTIIVPEESPEKRLLPSTVAAFDTTTTRSIEKNKHPNNKLIAAVLSFPLPFGLLGLHRIYLGTKPYIPFVYVGTIGGCFGIMPLIDFIAIITSKKDSLPRFEKSPKVFMWAH